MKVSVTQDHIDRGIGSDCGKCPVALALEGCGMERVKIMDEADEVSFFYPKLNKTVRLLVPGKVYDFVVEFDCGQPVFPFEFELEC